MERDMKECKCNTRRVEKYILRKHYPETCVKCTLPLENYMPYLEDSDGSSECYKCWNDKEYPEVMRIVYYSHQEECKKKC